MQLRGCATAPASHKRLSATVSIDYSGGMSFRRWGYHRHLLSLVACLVCVAVAVVLFFPSQDERLRARYSSLEVELVAVTQEMGPSEALLRLADVAATDPAIAAFCHDLAHEVGHAAHEALGLTGALAVQDDICGSGYIHGVIEEELVDHVQDMEQRFSTLCPAEDRRCFHGLGHGLMYVTQNDLPVSLEYCRTFPRAFQRIQCMEGVFMENFEADTVSHPSAYLYPKDPYRTCRDQSEPARGVCTFYFPRYFLRTHPDAYDPLVAFCQQLPPASADACVKGVGSAALKQHVLQPGRALDICQTVAGDRRSLCVEGMLSYLMVHYASTEGARSFCRDYLDAHWDALCSRMLTEGMRAYGE